MKFKKLLLLAIILLISACQPLKKVEEPKGVVYNQRYTSKDEVAQYLIEFEELPPNYITKEEAYKLGWEPAKQNLWKVTDQMSIGGDRFMNREGLLPKNTYYEADIDYQGKGRNAKRLVYSKDGSIYYTSDHYESFEEINK